MTNPEMHFVVSSNIEAIGYDADARQLFVRFVKSGETYAYFEVEEWLFQEFMNADSKGRFLNSRIKNVYQCAKL